MPLRFCMLGMRLGGDLPVSKEKRVHQLSGPLSLALLSLSLPTLDTSSGSQSASDRMAKDGPVFKHICKMVASQLSTPAAPVTVAMVDKGSNAAMVGEFLAAGADGVEPRMALLFYHTCTSRRSRGSRRSITSARWPSTPGKNRKNETSYSCVILPTVHSLST